MPKITKIYTRGGDAGETSLGSGRRVAKDSPRIAAFGTVDELNSLIGLTLSEGLEERLVEELSRVQNELFHVGADLCVPEDDKEKTPVPSVESRHVEALERLIDELTAEVGPLQNFILPGGTAGAAALHVARTVCRRAERDVVTLGRDEPVNNHILIYLNRLSDALFAMARFENKRKGHGDVLWDSRA